MPMHNNLFLFFGQQNENKAPSPPHPSPLLQKGEGMGLKEIITKNSNPSLLPNEGEKMGLGKLDEMVAEEENNYLSILFDHNFKVIEPIKKRSFNEIKTLQYNAKTQVVLPTTNSTLYKIELPKLTDNKTRTAIPFALEDKLAQDIESLHFAFDNQHYNNGSYLVIVVDLSWICEIINNLKNHGLSYDILTLDWFALKTEETWLLKNYVLVNSELFNGALTYDLASFYLKKMPQNQQVYRFADLKIPKDIDQEGLTITGNCYEFMAKRFQNIHPINIYQGKLKQSTKLQNNRSLQSLLVIACSWLIIFCSFNFIKIHSLNQQNKELDNKIAVIYHEFFPNAQQVISPRFRISKLLQTNKHVADSKFWVLLEKLTNALKNLDLKVNEITFQKDTLTVNLVSKNFMNLEKLQNNLQKTAVKIKQARSTTRDFEVLGYLELSYE